MGGCLNHAGTGNTREGNRKDWELSSYLKLELYGNSAASGWITRPWYYQLLPGAGQTGVALVSCVPPTPAQSSLPESLQAPVMNFSVLGRVWGSGRIMLHVPTGGCLSCRPLSSLSLSWDSQKCPRVPRELQCVLRGRRGLCGPSAWERDGSKAVARVAAEPPSGWAWRTRGIRTGSGSTGLPP